MEEDNKSKFSAEEVENLKQEGHERSLSGDSNPNTLADEIFDTDEEKQIRTDSFIHTNDVKRDAETLKQQQEDNDA